MESKPWAFLSGTPILKGVLLAFLIQALAVSFLVTLIHFTGLSDRHLSNLISLAVFIGVAGGGLFAAKAAEARYLLQGLGVGVVCFFIVLIVSLFNDVSLQIASAGKKALSFLGAGLVGGFLGALLGK